MYLLASAIVFAIFGLNVVMGAFGDAAFLGDLGEMLLLLAAVSLFVVAALKSEAARRDGEF